VVVSCRSEPDEDVLGWRLESILPDDWEVETLAWEPITGHTDPVLGPENGGQEPPQDAR